MFCVIAIDFQVFLAFAGFLWFAICGFTCFVVLWFGDLLGVAALLRGVVP